MRRIALALGAGLAVLAAAVLALPASAAQDCGRVRFDYREQGTRQFVEANGIRAQNAGCTAARRVARRYADASRFVEGPGHVAGWTCRWTDLGSDVGRARCRRGGAVVSFAIYDSSPYH